MSKFQTLFFHFLYKTCSLRIRGVRLNTKSMKCCSSMVIFFIKAKNYKYKPRQNWMRKNISCYFKASMGTKTRANSKGVNSTGDASTPCFDARGSVRFPFSLLFWNLTPAATELHVRERTFVMCIEKRRDQINSKSSALWHQLEGGENCVDVALRVQVTLCTSHSNSVSA